MRFVKVRIICVPLGYLLEMRHPGPDRKWGTVGLYPNEASVLAVLSVVCDNAHASGGPPPCLLL